MPKKPRLTFDPQQLVTRTEVEHAQRALSARAAELQKLEENAKFKPPKGAKLKLFVWDGALKSYSGGVVFALAYTTEQARALAIRELGESKDLLRDLKRDPAIYEHAVAFGHHGGD